MVKYTAKEFAELWKNGKIDAYNYELYSWNDPTHHQFHHWAVSDIPEELQTKLLESNIVVDTDVLNEEEYSSFTCNTADFAEWYDDKNAKVAVAIFPFGYDVLFRGEEKC